MPSKRDKTCKLCGCKFHYHWVRCPECGEIYQRSRKRDIGDLTPFEEIAVALGTKDVDTVIRLYNQGMKKLRKALMFKRAEIKAAYTPDPEPCPIYIHDKPMRASELPLAKFPVRPSRMFR